MIEAVGYSAFGLKIDEGDIHKIRLAFKVTYGVLEKSDERWRSLDFCKSQITSLWDSIVSFVDKPVESSEEKPVLREADKPISVNSEFLKKNLVMNTENEYFLGALSQNLNGANWLFKRLEGLETSQGSVRISYNEDQKPHSAVIDLAKFRKEIRGYSEQTKRLLVQFVEWIKLNKRTAITCVLAASVSVIAVISVLWAGVNSLEFAKITILFVIATICFFAEAMSMYGSVDQFLSYMAKHGIHIL